MLFSLPCWPTVFANYPSDQNSPPHNCFFTSGQQRNNSRAVKLFTNVTTLDTLYVGTVWTKKWTWSLSVPISKKFTSYRFSNSKQIAFYSLSTSSVSTTRRYFVGQTMWYNNTVTLWLLWMYLLSAIPPLYYAASGGELNPKRLKKGLTALLNPPFLKRPFK